MNFPTVPGNNHIGIKEEEKYLREVSKKGDFATYAVEWVQSVLNMTGIIAVISAIAAMFFLVRAEEPQTKKVGDYAGNCYVIAEMGFIVALAAFIALKVFIKWRG
jgi:hypothetical protein